MNLAYPAYRFLSTGLFFAGLPGFWAYARLTGRHRQGLPQRLGNYGAAGVARLPNRPRIWLHAASVGEVNAAAAVAEALRQRCPDAGLVVSTTSEHGHAAASQRMGAAAVCVLAPLDWSGAVARALDWVRPDVLVCVETEIWPTWLMSAQRRGVRTALVNGRISARSIRRYRHVQGLMGAVLAGMDALSMISVEDARRVACLGAPARRIAINGNAKFDLAGRPPDPGTMAQLRRRFNLGASVPVIVAGSTRTGEEQPVIAAYCRVRRRFDDAVLIIAPRHLRRVGTVLSEVGRRGLACQRRTELDRIGQLRTAPVVVLDTIGELRALYSIADVVFCGGSLVPRGGQNLLEPAAWGKPVVCGPHMDDFQAATDLLVAAGAVFPVSDAAALADRITFLLASPDRARAAGKAGRDVVAAHRGAAARHAGVIAGLLSKDDRMKD